MGIVLKILEPVVEDVMVPLLLQEGGMIGLEVHPDDEVSFTPSFTPPALNSFGSSGKTV